MKLTEQECVDIIKATACQMAIHHNTQDKHTIFQRSSTLLLTCGPLIESAHPGFIQGHLLEIIETLETMDQETIEKTILEAHGTVGFDLQLQTQDGITMADFAISPPNNE